MERYTPHKHTCEVKLCFSATWKDKCPLNGILSETEDECEQCDHFITVNFDQDSPTKITGIIRAEDSVVVAEQPGAYNK